ncbi:class C sortase [Dubosiella newyorkensis]|uniref:Class C sortase n=2 Tax=Dubosiella newyorkensis TaxID=1862672 RepID=A0A1U7NP76_9FIRM|nr:class C sortase [Dubosiella newyorkensis]OLU47278.1 class C sortase [Dubosiella newyorkensis]
MKKYIQKNFTTILLIVAFTVGLSLLLYPTIANWWNEMYAARAVATYDEAVAKLQEEDLELMYADAVKYNQLLLEEKNRYFPSEEMHELYEKTLNVNDDGLMGSVNIPKANINLPIFHGTDEDLLQKNVGHIEGSSLPVGGESTHAVISGHRGLPSARLFTDITKLVEGDTFTVRVLGKTLTYEVDQIRTVLPEETSDLEIVPGQDLMTLVTCTPYGINSHRLLVRGHRVPNALEGDGSQDASLFDRNLVAIVIAGTILFFLVGWIFLKDRFKK